MMKLKCYFESLSYDFWTLLASSPKRFCILSMFFFSFRIHRHTTTALLNIQRKVSTRSSIADCIVEKLRQLYSSFPLFTLHELFSNVFPLLWICFTPQATPVKETQLIAHTRIHTNAMQQQNKSALEAALQSLVKRAPIDFPLLNLNTLCSARCSQTNWHKVLASQVKYFLKPTLASISDYL